MKAFFTLLKIETKLSFRSADMLLFAILMPMIILLVVGLIYPPRESSMLEHTFGAFMSVGICAVGLMGLPLVLAEYRSRKVLKHLQVTPVHPGILLAVQFAVQTAVAVLSALLVTLTGVLVFGLKFDASLLSMIPGFFLVLISIFSIGLVIASSARDAKRAGILCSAVYFPMLLFSGTTIPFQVFPDAVQKIAVVLPLRHGIILLNGLSQGEGMINFLPQISVLSIVAILGILASLFSFRWDME